MGDSEMAIDRLIHLSDVVDMISHWKSEYGRELRDSCWIQLGEWKYSKQSIAVEQGCNDILMAFKRATAENSNNYKAWHNWGLINFRLAQNEKNQTPFNTSGSIASVEKINYPSITMRNHVVAAVEGFVKAVCLGTKRWTGAVQQDLLNFLSCIFSYGELNEVAAVIEKEIVFVQLEAWLGVLPQILARIHVQTAVVKKTLPQIMINLGEKHPQALMLPLNNLIMSPMTPRKETAEHIMKALKRKHSGLVDEARMVSTELIRVAIFWIELWHEALEDASRLYFAEGNIQGMLDVLLPLHKKIEGDPGGRSQRERDFCKTFAKDLKDAHIYLKRYQKEVLSDGGKIPTEATARLTQMSATETARVFDPPLKGEESLHRAWNFYYAVFRNVNKELPALTSCTLEKCSPNLFRARNLKLAIPGSYRLDGTCIRITEFNPRVQIITSKQRPRRILIRGHDKKDYVFGLKGHEDMRQDERAMQLFGLANALFARDRRTSNFDLNIQRYNICPLSHDAGLIGFVPNCETFHTLIKDFRQKNRILLNMESREMSRLSGDYDMLTVMQKVEIFSEALSKTTMSGFDLYEIYWTRSENSEEWLEHRTKYTRSLAVMSMVGYILGLGDRHPSNLMLSSINGGVCHIDFGDCFEVAMVRDKYPERVPFRLTRMLIKAMEISGIEGSFRSTCEKTMTVMRDNKDSLLAMLEAFVYDPLVSWRLLCQPSGGVEATGLKKNDLGLNQQREVGSQPQGEVGPQPQRKIGLQQQKDILKSLHQLQSTKPQSMNDGVLSRPLSVSQGMMKEPIREQDEEDVSGNNLVPSHVRVDEDVDYPKITDGQQQAMKIFYDIQSLAASVRASTSSRVASIAADGVNSERLLAPASVSKSRLGRSILRNAANDPPNDALNEKALKVIRRVQHKLNGTDFHALNEEGSEGLDVEDQVQRLIVQATSTQNLCQLFVGWYGIECTTSASFPLKY